MTRRNIIIDTDPGLDDAVAILLALASPEELAVEGVVAVAGNLPLAMTERNSRRVCALAGREDVPVYAGCERPLLRSLATAERLHGETAEDRLGLPEATVAPQDRHGVDFLVERVRATEPGTLSLCALGPLTNLAMALVKAPDIGPRLAEIVVMGGAVFQLGNVTPTAEFNIYCDPHAAQIVFASGVPLTLFSLDATHQVLSTPPRLAALRGLGNRCGAAVADLLDLYGRRRSKRFPGGGPLHDPCVVAWLLQPELFGHREVNIVVEAGSELTMGMTVADWWGVTDRKPNVRFVDRVDADGFYSLLTERLRRLP